MSLEPSALPIGTVLAARFEVLDVLGRGGFGIAYLAQDLVRDDQVVVKELAPHGVRRDSDGLLDLDGDPNASGRLLRQRFQQESLLLRRIRSSGVPSLRTTFTENGTAYAVTDYLSGSETLAKRLQRDGRMEGEAAREILVSLLDVLEKVHEAGILHRDIKPSNVLLGPRGEVLLIDFGAARDYASETQTVLYTPAYAPPEQLSERATRGPATDLYALAATIYHTLAGEVPASVHERVAGVALRPLLSYRRDIDPPLANAIEVALSLRIGDRPQSIAEMRALLSEDAEPEPVLDLAEIDRQLARARELKADRRGCPACEGVLFEPRPLRRLGCPVCRDGLIRDRNLDDRRCPVCRDGRLAVADNERTLSTCPSCVRGRITFRRRGLGRIAVCDRCERTYERQGELWRRDDDEAHTAKEWTLLGGRSLSVRLCDTCDAQFDAQRDGRWAQIIPPPENPYPLYSDEWARVAAGLEPGGGNAECDVCHSDFWIDRGRVTLLEAPRDPFQFAAAYEGRSLPTEDVRWVGVAKTSGQAGPLCDRCATEFDIVGGELRLVHSPHRALARQAGETHALEDWHRLAQGLPCRSEEGVYEARLDELLRASYRAGVLPFDSHSNVDWRGRAVRDDGSEGTLTFDATELSFGGVLRRWRVSAGEILEVAGSGSDLAVQLATGIVRFEVVPIDLVAQLQSGARTIYVDAEDLAARVSGR